MMHERTGQLQSQEGVYTTVLYGCLDSIRKLWDTIGGYDQVIFCWDEGKSFRYQIFEDYKDKRNYPDHDLVKSRVYQQMQTAQHVLNCLKVPQFSVSGLEGDDCLGLLSHHYHDAGWNVVIVSSDKDLYQLLTDRISVYDGIKNE